MYSFLNLNRSDKSQSNIIMKNLLTLKPLLLSSMLLLFIGLVSCSDDEIFVEPESTEQVAEGEPETPGTSENPEDSGEEVVDTSLPCNFTLTNAEPNSTVVIDCTMNLEKATITIPSGVTILSKGGSITNGTINFSEGTTIDSKLLNNTITLGGSAPVVKDDTFEFAPERWGVVEGEVSDEVAFSNRNLLQNAIDLAKSLNVKTFEIGAMDAYFHLDYVWTDAEGYNERAIHLPSDFHLKMNDETYLKLQPNFWPRGTFVGIYNESNVQISGGNLIGDRFKHDYSPINDELGLPRDTHEWPGVLVISGSKNIILDGVFMGESTGDALILGASGHRTDPATEFNENIIVRNCTMHKSRRNNVSITDGEDITIEGCTITEAGLGEDIFNGNTKIISSAGIAPKVGIDIEPFRGIEPNGEFINFEKVERVLITGCTFKDNNVSSFINFSGTDIVFDNNFSDHSIGASFDRGGTKFYNNTLEANEKNRLLNGINFGTFIVNVNGREVQYSSGSEAIGNKISGFLRGVRATGENPIIRGNTIENFEVGVQVDSYDVVCENNTMTTNRFVAAHGISFTNLGGGRFSGNNITVPRSPVFFSNLNQANGDSQIQIHDNFFESLEKFPLIFRNVKNVLMTENEFKNTTVEESSSQITIHINNTFL